MFHQTHTTVAWPALFVVVADDVLVIRIRMLGKIALNEVATLVGRESEEHMNAVDVALIESNGMSGLGGRVAELEKLVGHLWRTGKLAGSLQTKDQQVEHQSVVLRDERRELQTTNQTIGIDVVHILVVEYDVVLGGHVVGQIVIENKTQQSIEQRQIDLFIHSAQFRLQQHIALAVAGIPHVCQIVDALTL